MNDDLIDSLGQLPTLENYSHKDRYHDFRRVFTGTEEGRRVLRHILDLGCFTQEPPLISPVDPYYEFALKGRRWLAAKILSIINAEPPPKPRQAVRRPTRSK